MADTNQRLRELEEELRKTPYNKRTQHAVGLLKAKIARLRDKSRSHAGKKQGAYSYSVKKSGDASAVLVGYPSVGKSTLLNALTNANSQTGEYAFTTLDVIPGVMNYKHAQIQVLDVPGILKGASIGKGRGREVLAVVQATDLVLFLVDVHHPEHLSVIMREIYNANIRVNCSRPDVKIVKKPKGGISIGTTVRLSKISRKTVEAILREYRISNADVTIRTDIGPDELIDVIEANKRYVPAIVVLTKADLASPEELRSARTQATPDIIVSAAKNHNIPALKELIYKRLGFIRIFCKEAGKKADTDEPLILRSGASVQDMCRRLHRDFATRFRYAKVWGRSAKFPGQRQGLCHVLNDGDIVELHQK